MFWFHCLYMLSSYDNFHLLPHTQVTFTWLQLDSNPEPLSSYGWVFVYELSGFGFESSCSHLNFRFRVCFEQGVPWHSGNYTLWIHSETRTWHDKNLQVTFTRPETLDEKKVRNMFNDVVLMFVLLTLNIFHTFF